MNKNWHYILKEIVLAMMLLSLVFAAISQGQTLSDDRAEKAGQTAAKIGTGKKAKVEVRLRDSGKLKGHIASTTTDSFTLVEEKSGDSRVVLFSDVDQLKKGGGLSTAGWIGIGAVAAVAAVIIGFIVARCQNEGGC